MGYQLVFWREEVPCGKPSDTYARLMEEISVSGLASIPTEPIVLRIASAFSEGIEGVSDGFGMSWVAEDDASSFQVETSAQHVLVELRPLNRDIANTIIDIATEFGCPLYDPQTDERFA